MQDLSTLSPFLHIMDICALSYNPILLYFVIKSIPLWPLGALSLDSSVSTEKKLTIVFLFVL